MTKKMGRSSVEKMILHRCPTKPVVLYRVKSDWILFLSFEKRLEIRRESRLSNISTSPILMKPNKLYYETCLSSATRNIETTEAKTKINEANNIIVPDYNNTLYRSNRCYALLQPNQ